MYMELLMLLNSFDFNDTCLSSRSRQQLNNILKAVKPGSNAADKRSNLQRWIEQNAFDRVRGIYIPLAENRYLPGKFPDHSAAHRATAFPSQPFPFELFTNGLCIPDRWGTDSFDPSSAIRPKHRATNIGFVVVTIEFDGKTTDRLEECLSWTRGGDGEFVRSPFAKVDRELSRFSDYRGYSIIFAGNKSVHFDLVFSTKHLLNARWDCVAEGRLTHPQDAIMDQAHNRYWDMVADVFHSLLRPSLPPDRTMRSLTQWRRSPGATRQLDDDSTVLGLPKGTCVPQLVVNEKLLCRASPRSSELLVPADFNVIGRSHTRSRYRQISIIHEDHQELLVQLQECCRKEWGEFPGPVSVRLDGGEWIIHFRNHPNDRNPSTIAMGDFSKLFLQGEHFFTSEFYLPNNMTADELCDSLMAGPGTTSDAASDKSPDTPLIMRKRGWN
jgi:hypothetical protein